MLNPVDLLRRLSAGIHPDGTLGRRVSADPLELLDFEALLESVHDAPVESARPVIIAPGADIQLSDAQIERLVVVIDVAERRGAQSLLAVLDGQGLSVRVAERLVDEGGAALNGRLLAGFDLAVVIPEIGARELRQRLADPEARARRTIDPVALLVGPAPNASLGRLLAEPGREGARLSRSEPVSVPGGAR